MRTAALALLFATTAITVAMDPTKPILARNPSIASDTIVFEFGTDLWTVPREGGKAKRLTVGQGIETAPHVSPDGKWVAFTGEYEGNPDVFVMPIGGGQPKRLTFHPGEDTVQGWTPDGKAVLYSSSMDHPNGEGRLYTVTIDGGWPEALPLPRGMRGSYSPDSMRIAYVPHDLWQPEWKRYKGGQTPPIWIADLANSKITKVPRENSNDNFPMWMGDDIYFVSDRNGRSTLFSYGVGSKKVSQVLPPSELDVKSASAGNGVIVYEKIGGIYLFDPKSKATHQVPIEIEDDFTELRPTYKSVGNMINDATISPSGARAAFEARGEIFTVPIENGDPRNLTNNSGTAERSPIWSPDGNKIAYLSDKTGNYRLYIVDQKDGSKAEEYRLSDKDNFYHGLNWSPDGKSITYVDQDMKLYILDVATKQYKTIDREPYYFFGDSLYPSWSPDSNWLVYTKHLPNKMSAVFVYSMATGKIAQLTDGLSDAQSAVFDKSGKYLYFLASTDIAETISVGGMSSMNHPISYTAYVIVLDAEDPSPFAPESDEEEGTKSAADGPPPGATPPPSGPPPPPGPRPVKIDFEGVSQRILTMPLPPGLYTRIIAGAPRSAFFLRIGNPLGNGPTAALKYSFDSKQVMPWSPTIGGMVVTPKGDKALIQGPSGWQVVSTGGPVQPGAGAVNTSNLQSYIDPKAEWRQMFYEVWRNMRDFFYDPNTHGLDITKVEKRYEPYLENLISRQDYNYLMQDMLNEVTVGHTFSGGGELPSGDFVPGGLLGADYKRNEGRYQFSKIYNGENWNPGLRAPLTQPGATVKPGEFLIKVNGKEVTDKDNIYQVFENTAGKQVSISVGTSPSGSDARTITVVPVASEGALRYRAWVEGNRRKVDDLSGGKVSYVYIPDTGGGGYSSFNRYFTAQLDKPAVLVDDRFNHGGALSDYIIQILNRQVLGMAAQRDNTDFAIPMLSNEGPKAMLINEMAGSGGDALPWFFRVGKVGPLFGKRTWGGLVAASPGVPLMGGGGATAPQLGIYGLDGEWGVENHGVAPDVEVEEDPFLWRQGKDPQLEAAVKYLVEQLAKNPPKVYKRPPFPDYHKGDPLGKS